MWRYAVIDTAHLYAYRGMPSATPGLADLSKAVLGRAIRAGVGAIHSQVRFRIAYMLPLSYYIWE
eukprot:COSAG01_NODE_7890_length_3004_cov_8.444062_1_plen_65_part_00